MRLAIGCHAMTASQAPIYTLSGTGYVSRPQIYLNFEAN